MPTELDSLIEQSLDLRRRVQELQAQYDANRSRILEIMAGENRNTYLYGSCRVLRTGEVFVESVSKDMLIQALKEVDIPREKKVFIWKRAVKKVWRPSTVLLQRNRDSSAPPVS